MREAAVKERKCGESGGKMYDHRERTSEACMEEGVEVSIASRSLLAAILALPRCSSSRIRVRAKG
jgi:hypothetical protein